MLSRTSGGGTFAITVVSVTLAPKMLLIKFFHSRQCDHTQNRMESRPIRISAEGSYLVVLVTFIHPQTQYPECICVFIREAGGLKELTNIIYRPRET